jgi:hypothetical protein
MVAIQALINAVRGPQGGFSGLGRPGSGGAGMQAASSNLQNISSNIAQGARQERSHENRLVELSKANELREASELKRMGQQNVYDKAAEERERAFTRELMETKRGEFKEDRTHTEEQQDKIFRRNAASNVAVQEYQQTVARGAYNISEAQDELNAINAIRSSPLSEEAEMEIAARGWSGMSDEAMNERETRLHDIIRFNTSPENRIESFKNVYKDFGFDISGEDAATQASSWMIHGKSYDVPLLIDGKTIGTPVGDNTTLAATNVKALQMSHSIQALRADTADRNGASTNPQQAMKIRARMKDSVEKLEFLSNNHNQAMDAMSAALGGIRLQTPKGQLPGVNNIYDFKAVIQGWNTALDNPDMGPETALLSIMEGAGPIRELVATALMTPKDQAGGTPGLRMEDPQQESSTIVEVDPTTAGITNLVLADIRDDIYTRMDGRKKELAGEKNLMKDPEYRKLMQSSTMINDTINKVAKMGGNKFNSLRSQMFTSAAMWESIRNNTSIGEDPTLLVREMDAKVMEMADVVERALTAGKYLNAVSATQQAPRQQFLEPSNQGEPADAVQEPEQERPTGNMSNPRYRKALEYSGGRR